MNYQQSLIDLSGRLVETAHGVKIVDVSSFPEDEDSIRTNLSAAFDFPCQVYFLDTASHVMKINDFGASSIGYDSAQDAVGRNPLYIAGSKKDAIQCMVNDADVITKKKVKIIDEDFGRHDGFVLHVLSIKIPWYDQKDNLIGLLGLSVFNNDHAIYLTEKMGLMNIRTQLKRLALAGYNKIIDNIPLSRRQIECLYWLIRGKTSKQIGKILGLSPRTVECYVENLKSKLRCSCTGEVIEKAVDSGFADFKLAYLSTD